MSATVVRRFGSGRTHVADVDLDFDTVEVTVFGSTGRMVALTPVAAVCTAQLKGEVVVMEKATVDCRTCARLSGVSRVEDGEVTA